MADWKLRRIIRRPDGSIRQTDWPGNPAPYRETQQRMVTEAAVDVWQLGFRLRNLQVKKLYLQRSDGQRREYNLFKA